MQINSEQIFRLIEKFGEQDVVGLGIFSLFFILFALLLSEDSRAKLTGKQVFQLIRECITWTALMTSVWLILSTVKLQ